MAQLVRYQVVRIHPYGKPEDTIVAALQRIEEGKQCDAGRTHYAIIPISSVVEPE